MITNPNERHQVELLAHAIGRSLDEVNQATAPVVSLFQNVHLGNNPGEFRLTERNVQPGAQPQGQQVGPQGQNIQQQASGAQNVNAENVSGGQRSIHIFLRIKC